MPDDLKNFGHERDPWQLISPETAVTLLIAALVLATLLERFGWI